MTDSSVKSHLLVKLEKNGTLFSRRVLETVRIIDLQGDSYRQSLYKVKSHLRGGGCETLRVGCIGRGSFCEKVAALTGQSVS